MLTVQAVTAFLDQFAPPSLAEDWDNVGLLVGDRDRRIERVMTCLTITPPVAAEAVGQHADLIVAHHPLPLFALKRLTTETTTGSILLDLVAARMAVYSPHTAFDSASQGINQRLAAGLSLRGITPLVPRQDGPGAGRWGWLAEPLALGELAERVKKFLAIERSQLVGDPRRPIRTVAVACGAADSLVDAAIQIGCDSLVIGEARFHTCIEAEARDVALVIPGHFASERFAVDCLAQLLADQFSELEVWASREERDPVCWV